MQQESLLLLLLSLGAVTLLPNEEQAQAKSMIGNYSDGYEDDKENGEEDNSDDQEHDSKCPPNDRLAYCTGYKAGYEVGWFASGDNKAEN